MGANLIHEVGQANYLGVPCRRMPPTRKHRPAVWEAMLGTVYALSEDGECRYFDYNHEAALEFAGVGKDQDPRLHRVAQSGTGHRYIRSGATEQEPRRGKLVLWILRKEQS